MWNWINKVFHRKSDSGSLLGRVDTKCVFRLQMCLGIDRSLARSQSLGCCDTHTFTEACRFRSKEGKLYAVEQGCLTSKGEISTEGEILFSKGHAQMQSSDMELTEQLKCIFLNKSESLSLIHSSFLICIIAFISLFSFILPSKNVVHFLFFFFKRVGCSSFLWKNHKTLHT